MPELDWHRFTELPGAATSNFEMLWRALIRRHYGRFGDFRALANQPGVEFHLRLHSSCDLGNAGRWYGWQCKWYAIPGGKPIGTRRRSEIRRALDLSARHLPDLTDWILCTRFSLTAGDQSWFYGLPTAVRLHLWTASELDEHLSGPGEIFRSTYFGDLVLTPELLHNLHVSSVASIRNRWIPEVHQRLDAEREVLRVLGTAEAWSDLSALAKRLLSDVSAFQNGTAELPASLRRAADDLVDTAKAQQDRHARVQNALEAGAYEDCQDGSLRASSIDDWNALLRALRGRRHPMSLDATNLVSGVQEFDEMLLGLGGALSLSVLVVVAAAGCGKTHLAAQLTAETRNRPAGILLYGRDLNARQGLDDLARRVTIHGNPIPSFEALVAAVDAAGRRAGRRLPIVIDGLNEAEDPRGWKGPLAGVNEVVKPYPYVLIVCTLRGEFFDDAVPGAMDRLDIKGFEEDVVGAASRYFQYYNIDRSDVALPWRLLNHPLTMRMFCEVTNPTRRKRVGVEAMPTCLTALFDRYIEQVADRIARLSSSGGRFQKEDVWQAIEEFGRALWEMGARSIDMKESRKLLMDDGRTWHASIVRALEQDGILLRIKGTRSGNGNCVVVYDALAGHIVANSLCNDFPEEQFERWFRRRDTKRKIFGDSSKGHPLATDILNGLVGLSPRRRRGKHVWPLLTGPRRAAALCQAARLEGEYLDSKTVRALGKLLVSGVGPHLELFRDLRSTRAAVEHPLNANFLDSTLRAMTVAERDLCWTEWVRLEKERLTRDFERLENRWQKTSPGQRGSEDERLRARWVMWTLTSTVRPLRDRATRALYRYGSRYPGALFELALEALTINDLYVPERMLAACYGVAMTLWGDPGRQDVRVALLSLGRALNDRVLSAGGTNATAHVLMREYAGGLVELADRITVRESIESSGERRGFAPRQSAPAPDPFRDPTLIEESEIGDVKGAIRMDFGNYTIGRLIPRRQNYDFENETYREVRRQIEARIAELGYSEIQFRDVESRIGRGEWRGARREGAKTDRYGKKYAWIAYFEMYGLREDRRLLPEWRRGERTPDVDIDPSFPEPAKESVLDLRDVFVDAPSQGPLWMRSGVTPEYDHLLYCEEVDGQSGPWALLEGYIEQASQDDDRKVFTFLRGVFVRSDDVGRAARAFSLLQYPGNWEIPEPAVDHYLYAGEIPWSRRFGGELRELDGSVRADRRDAFSTGMQTSGISVEIPVCRFGWESYHSELNQVSGVVLPAPAICDLLGLTNRQGEWDLRDRYGKLATMYRESRGSREESRSTVTYIQSELLSEYLTQTDQKLMWFLWGERTLRHGALMALREELRRDVYGNYGHIHARWRVFDGEVGGRMLKAEDVEYDDLDG